MNGIYSSMSIRISQTEALMRKNAILYLRRWKTTLLQILAPILIVVLLWGLDRLVINSNSDTYTSPRIFADTQNMPRCPQYSSRTCYSLAYTTQGNDAHRIIQRAIAATALPATEVHAVSRSPNVNATAALDQWLLENQNTTYTAVAVTPNHVYPEGEVKAPVAYHIFYNTSADMPSAAPLQVALDNAIIADHLNTPASPSLSTFIRASFRGYPQPSPVGGSTTMPVSGTVGPQFLCFAMMLTFVVLVYIITNEKHRLLRLAMATMGLTDLPYWLSWFLSAIAIAGIVAFAVVLTGIATRIPLFARTNFFVLLLLFGLFALSLVGLAFLITSLVSRPKTGLVISFVVVGVTFIVNGIFTNTIIIYALYSFNPTWLQIVRTLLFFYPPFNFGKVYADLFFAASPRLNSVTNEYVPGPGFSFTDLFRSHSYSSILHAPPSYQSLLLLIANFVLFTVIAVYIDIAFPGSTGIPRHPLFPFLPSYWGINRSHSRSTRSEPQPRLDPDMDPDVAAEIRDAFRIPEDDVDDDDDVGISNNNNNNNNNNDLRILNVHKMFRTLRQRVTAVNGVSLTARSGACTALLGHNGAGKTTTINMITGLTTPTSGQILLLGHSVADGLSGLRRHVGVCPQHDILWDELTAGEHLRLFARVKGVPWREVSAEIGRRLHDVALEDVRRRRTETFSGGMKRRLSVAVSMVGDPALVLMDEPTTGMDPRSRRQVWRLIHAAKHHRIVLLTTHSMEEAEALADKIAIMAFGRVRCVGDVLHLKHRYGAGYNLSLQAQPGVQATASLKQRVHQMLPSARLVSDNAGNLMYNLSGPTLGELVPVLEHLETAMEEGEDLKDWGISQTTLEEVYLRVTKEAQFGFGTNRLTPTPTPTPTPNQEYNNNNNNNNIDNDNKQ